MNTYFANLPDEELGRELVSRVRSYYEDAERTGRLALWQKSHRQYFSVSASGRHDGAHIKAGGESGELSIMRANHYRNLLQHLLVLATQNRAAFECTARNTDYRSQVQTILGKNVLEYYLRAQRLDQSFREGVEVAVVYGDCCFELEWDDDAGAEYVGDPELNEFIHVGDIRLHVHEPINAIRPTGYIGKAKAPWYILRRWVNKYDLAMKNVELAEHIVNMSSDDELKNYYYTDVRGLGTADEQEVIPVFRFYHSRSPACPSGKIVEFLSDGTIIKVRPLESKEFPVYSMIPQRHHGTAFGYTVAFDLLVVQEAIDLLYSTVLSNQASFGVQNIWVKPGSNLSPMQLSGGLNLFESPEKPEPINLTNTPAEIFKFLEGLEKLGEVLSGVNAVARGQPEASLKSGAALALVAAQAVQFSNGLQASYIQALEDIGTGIIQHLQDRAVLPRLAAIAGKNNRSYVKEFTGKDIIEIDRVIVNVGNPVARTLAGRIQMAQDLLQAQVLKRPEDYLQIIETGTVEPAIEDQRNQEFMIQAENEAIRQGQPVKALLVDDHRAHILGHASITATSDERMDPELISRQLAHIQEHLAVWRSAPPELMQALGYQPLAMGMGPQGPNAPQPNAGGGEQGPPQQGQPTPPGEQVAAPQGASPEIAANMPKMPEPQG